MKAAICIVGVLGAMLWLGGCGSGAYTSDDPSADVRTGNGPSADVRAGNGPATDVRAGSDLAADGSAGGQQASGELTGNARVVKVTARKYEFAPSEIVVMQGEAVHLDLTSTDVPHGFFLADYAIDVKIEPGKTSAADFVATGHSRSIATCSAARDIPT